MEYAAHKDNIPKEAPVPPKRRPCMDRGTEMSALLAPSRRITCINSAWDRTTTFMKLDTIMIIEAAMRMPNMTSTVRNMEKA